MTARCESLSPLTKQQCGLPKGHFGRHQNGPPSILPTWDDVQWPLLPTKKQDESDVA